MAGSSAVRGAGVRVSVRARTRPTARQAYAKWYWVIPETMPQARVRTAVAARARVMAGQVASGVGMATPRREVGANGRGGAQPDCGRRGGPVGPAAPIPVGR